MNELYLPVRITCETSVSPGALGKGLYNTIRKQIHAKLNNRCIPRVGHILPGSIEIVDKNLGEYYGNHTTGNILYRVVVSCKAAQPVKGAKITCRVIGKNDAGLLAQNFKAPFIMFVPKDRDNFDYINSINPNDTVEVEILDWKLQAATRDQPISQYWIISRIVQRILGSTALTQVGKYDIYAGDFVITRGHQEANRRSELTARWYDVLESVKREIDDTIKELYIEHLKRTPAAKDFVIRNTVQTSVDIDGVWYLDSEKRPRLITGSEKQVPDVDERETTKGDILVVTGNRTTVINIWCKHIKYVINDYELLRPNRDYIKQLKSIGADVIKPRYSPVSRAYYKLYEMLIRKFEGVDILPNKLPTNVLCLAEAPGGFIEALIQYGLAPGSSITGISISERGKANVWEDLEGHLVMPNVQVTLDRIGPQEKDKIAVNLIGNRLPTRDPGDILIKENREWIHENLPKAELITADGGVQHGSEEEHEIYAARLILAEILMAIRQQKEGGAFVLKIFDITTQLTVNFISLLNHFYTSVNLYKPHSSRPASSEKYLVCLGYSTPLDAPSIGQTVRNIEYTLDNWGEPASIISLFPNTTELQRDISSYNDGFMKLQIDFIQSGIEYMNLYTNETMEGLKDYLKTRISRQRDTIRDAGII